MHRGGDQRRGRQAENGQERGSAVRVLGRRQIVEQGTGVVRSVGRGGAGFVAGVVQALSGQRIPSAVVRSIAHFDENGIHFGRTPGGGEGFLQHGLDGRAVRQQYAGAARRHPARHQALANVVTADVGVGEMERQRRELEQVGQAQVGGHGVIQVIVELRYFGDDASLQGAAVDGAQHFLRTAAAVEVAGFLA